MKNPDHILIIEDDVIFSNTLTATLRKEGFDITEAHDSFQALEAARKKPFELIVADIRLPGEIDGIEILSQIKKIYNYPTKYIVMTAYADKDAPIRAIRLGVDDYIFKPFRLEEFIYAVRKSMQMFHLEKDVSRYRELSNRDGLTTLYNHRFFYETLKREMGRAERYQHSLSLLMIDIDGFKEFNDNYGHLAGDVILKEISEIFIRCIRSVDLAFRYGGEEFAIILPETNKDGAIKAGERIRKNIKETSFEGIVPEKTLITVSIGVSNFPVDTNSKENLISMADESLYEAKKLGKNRIYFKEDREKTGNEPHNKKDQTGT